MNSDRMKKRQATSIITPTKGRPAAPSQLVGEARAEWDRVCDELDGMGTLCTSDRSIIALYVMAWARWMQAEEKIAASGPIVAAPKTKTPMHNPWRAVSNDAHQQAVKLLGELGLTPKSRSIIAANTARGVATSDVEEPADDFADLD